MTQDTQSFAYHRSLEPVLWVLIGLSICELCILHLLIALVWSRWVAIVLSLASLCGVGWLAIAIRSFRHLPVLIEPTRIVLRAGIIKCISIERANVASIEQMIGAEEAKRPDVLKLSLLAYPNIVIHLRQAIDVGRGRKVRTVVHRLDAPTAFIAALSDRSGQPLI